MSFFNLVYKNSVDDLAIERKIGKKSDLNETEHPVLMVWFETSAHLKHLNPSFRGLLYLCEQSVGLYSFLIQDFTYTEVLSQLNTQILVHPRPPLWRDALSVTLECAYCYGFTRPASEARDREGKKMKVGDSMSRSIIFCLTFTWSVTSVAVWVTGPSLWEVCSATFALPVALKF